MAASDGDIRLTKDGFVATITIDRPEKLNAITPHMATRFFEVADEINETDEIRVAVILGAGERAFSAGSDINMLREYGTPWQMRTRKDYARAVWTIRKPVIAAIRGHCIGGGGEIALYSDIRIASETARFGFAEIHRGWHAGIAPLMLPRLVGQGKAMELLLTGDPIDAEAALRLGLVERLVADAELEGTAGELAERIARLSPIGVQATKHLVRVGSNVGVEQGIAWQNDLIACCFATEDAEEGMRAFREKREPEFKGR